MGRNIHQLFNVAPKRRLRFGWLLAGGFIVGIMIGLAFLFLPVLLATPEDAPGTAAPIAALSAPAASTPPAIVLSPPVRADRRPAPAPAPACARVSVHDGDTFRCDGMKVRLVAASGPLDAPEMPGSPRCDVGRGGWCDADLAAGARDRLAIFLNSGAVVLDCDGADRYGRALCRASVGERDAGDLLVAEGLARIEERWR